MFRFHSVCGTNVKLSPDCRTAERICPKTDFNNALLFTDQPLSTNIIFQIQIQKKISVWNGGVEIGVTKLNPDSFTSESLPQIATELKNGTWLMSSRTILEDGETLVPNYGYDLEKLNEGDTVGLTRTAQGNLIFFVNGTPQGVAVSFIPNDVYCVVSLYGKCSQVTLVDVQVSDQCTNTVELSSSSLSCGDNENISYSYSGANVDNNAYDRLKFHEKCGPLVKLCNQNRVAERKRPMEEFNNAVVLTHRPLGMNELFQIRIDMLIKKWSGSLEFGLTGHQPDSFELPATLTVVKNTVIMSGNGVLHNGKATSSPYTHFNLDQLQEGDRLGVMMKSNGEVHYFVNGIDQGIATTGLSSPVWGCLNLYGMAAKVTIVDRNEHEEHNLRLSVRGLDFLSSGNFAVSEDCLLFHSNCGFHSSVINGGKTAHRPNARDDFNHGVVLTNRVLRSNELFEVRLDKLVTKWAGSIEIGVTTHSPTQNFDFPCTMTNVRTGTWILTGNGIMHNGVSIIDDFGQSLDRLKVGDTVGVLRKESGNLHFYVNGEDQGCAATNVPANVYGVIDLYGQAAEATIVTNNRDNSLSLPCENSFTSSVDTGLEGSVPILDQSIKNSKLGNHYDGDDARFHILCGKNARVSNNGMTVSRPNASQEFNAAIGISSRELKDDELFEVVIERMVDRWSGNLEVGVTTLKPDELFTNVNPNTMTDVDHDTWILSGSNFMIGGSTVTHRYNCNLDSLTVGSRVGIMRKSDSTLHFFVNGDDKGAACEIPQLTWAVIDLYGQCQQVSIIKSDGLSFLSSQIVESLNLPLVNDLGHRFSNCCGKNIILKSNNLEATRIRHYTNALVFSGLPLEVEEIFEVRLTDVNKRWAGCLVIGITTLSISDDYPASLIPHSISSICSETWFIAGSQVRKNNVVIRENYCFNLHRLCEGDRVGVRISGDKCLHCYINGEDMGVAVHNLPKVQMHAVFDIFGKAETITICSSTKNFLSPTHELSCMDSSNEVSISSEVPVNNTHQISTNCLNFESKYHGANIELTNDNMIAVRKTSYNQGIVITSQILRKEELFQIRINRLNPKWTSSLMIGVIDSNFERQNIPWCAMQFKYNCCIISGDSVFRNGYKTKHSFGPNLDTLQEGHLVGIFIDARNDLHLIVNGIDQGIACNEVETCSKAVLDLYGMCEEVVIVPSEKFTLSPLTQFITNEKPTDENILKHCEYLSACIRFKNTLCLPDPYFPSSEPTVCYCANCSKLRGGQLTSQHGDPQSEYTMPVGWVRFPVTINFEYPSQNPMMTSSTSSLNNVLTTWHVAYHGLRISHVREVLDVGELFACDPEFESFRDDFLPHSKQRDEYADGSILMFSPCTEYAAIPEFAPTHLYNDKFAKKKCVAKVLFQILAKPGSYKVGAASFPSPVFNSNTKFPSTDIDSIEWATKEDRSTHITALLVHLEENV